MYNYIPLTLKGIFRILLIANLFAIIFFIPRSVLADDLSPDPAAEAYLLNELRTTGYADLQYFQTEESVVGGDFLASALKDPDVQRKSLIYIANVTVVDYVPANDLVIPANILFTRMKFSGYVDFDSAQMQAITITESEFLDDVNFSLTTFNGNIIISNNTFQNLVYLRSALNGNVDLRDNTINGSLNFYGTHVSGELLFDGSQILGTTAMEGASSPTELWTTTVDGVTSFAGAYFKGYANFSESDFKQLDMDGVTYDGGVSFNGTNVERSADFSNAKFSGETNFTNFQAGSDITFNSAVFNDPVVFENATTARDANFIDATFSGDAIFDYFTAGRFVDFSNATFNLGFSFFYTTAAYPYFENTVFNGPVSFEGMQTSQDFELVNASYNYTEEPLPVDFVDVTGAVRFTGITAPAGLLLSNSHFGSLSISTKDNPDIASIDLTATDIDGNLQIENVNTKTFAAEGASVGKSTTLHRMSITDQLDMSNASIGFLKVDDQFKAPNDPKSFNLRGMTYTDIDLGDQGLTEKTWHGLLQLIDQSAYSPQAYQALSQFLTDKGHPDWASQVDLAQKRRERNEVLTPLSGPWLWSWFLDIFDGYGFRPALAFIWAGLVVTIGAFVFRRKEDMLPVDQDDAKVEYNPIWYSFALFLPYIDLGIASKWEPNPERKWARNYKYIHMILGWVIAPIALLTFGGILG